MLAPITATHAATSAALVALTAWITTLGSPPQRLPTNSAPQARRVKEPALLLGVLAAGALSGLVLTVAWPVALSLAAIICTVSYISTGIVKRRRADTVATATAEVFATISGQLKAGSTMAAALSHTCDALRSDTHIPPLLVQALQASAHACAQGRDGSREFMILGNRAPHLAAAGRLWHTAQRYGMSISDLWMSAAHSLNTDIRHAHKTAAALSGPRTSALVLAALPLVGILLGELIGGSPVAFLFTHSTGQFILIGGVLLTCAGLITADKLLDKAAAPAGTQRKKTLTPLPRPQ